MTMSALTYKLKNQYAQSKYKKYIDAVLVILLISLLLISITGHDFIDNISEKLGVETGSVYTSNYPVNFHIIDVGTADCMILSCNDHHVLIDGGKYEDLERVLNYLESYQIDKFDAVICSHPDSDHMGTFEKILENYPVEVFYQSPIMENSKKQEVISLRDKLDELNIPVYSLRAGDSFKIDTLKFDVLAPVKDYDKTNDMSLIIKATMGDFSLLLCGDMAENELNDLMDSDSDLDVDILKVAHHGSDTGTSPEFIEKCSPEYAVVSVGRANRYLPSKTTVAELRNYGCQILQTENEGNIVISTACDGRYKIKIREDK